MRHRSVPASVTCPCASSSFCLVLRLALVCMCSRGCRLASSVLPNPSSLLRLPLFHTPSTIYIYTIFYYVDSNSRINARARAHTHTHTNTHTHTHTHRYV